MATDSNYKHSELTDTIIGVFYDVYNELGFGFLESVYRKSLKLALQAKGLKVEGEVPGPGLFSRYKCRRFSRGLGGESVDFARTQDC